MSNNTPPPSTKSTVENTVFWHLVHTKARQERVALENLLRQGYECYCPQIVLEKVRRNKAQMVQEALFPRYLFIRLDSSGRGLSWAPVRSTLGVTQLVRFGMHPARIDDALIQWLREREQEHALHPQRLFEVGQTVEIVNGPFAGLQGIYQNPDAESRSMVLIEFLSQPVSVRIETAALRQPQAPT